MLKRIDLSRDYEKHKEEYLNAIQEVCRETAYSGGKFADQFDREFAEFCKVPYAAGVNNGTSALHCAMMALKIGAGDEVIVPANTYIATAWGVTYTGATPVFVDCTQDTWEIDPDKIEEKITERTKAIIGVHLYGQPFEFNRVKAIADKYGLFVVEDCAQAHGACYERKLAGSLGELGCFSFYPGKNLYAFGEGGSVTCHKKEYYDAITTIKNQGCQVRYYHDVIVEKSANDILQGLQIPGSRCRPTPKTQTRCSIYLSLPRKIRMILLPIWGKRVWNAISIIRCPAICKRHMKTWVIKSGIALMRNIWQTTA